MESEKSINTLSDKDANKKTPILSKRTLNSSSKRDFSSTRKFSLLGKDSKRITKKKLEEEEAKKDEDKQEDILSSETSDHTIANRSDQNPVANTPPKLIRNPITRQKDNPYLRAKVQTASGGELIIMLYEKAILNLKVASESLELEEKDFVKASKNIQNAQEIILELLYSLDIESGSDFAKKMAGLYAFINKELSEANIEKSNKRIEPIIQQLEVLLSAWKKANEQLKNQDS